jgi:hypothetical protein
MRQLKEMQAFTQEHHFTIKEWDIASVGWFHDLHPNRMCYNMIVNHSNTLMANAIKTSFPPKTQIPFYKLSNCTPKYQAEGHDDMRTKAIQITCIQSSSKQLHKLLVKAYADNTIYVPRPMDSSPHKPHLVQKLHACSTQISVQHLDLTCYWPLAPKCGTLRMHLQPQD